MKYQYAEQGTLAHVEIELRCLLEKLKNLDLDAKVDCINLMRVLIHDISPFKSEPVDLVQWVKNTTVGANDYNPNTVAPPEMELLRLSIASDGYTQPIVTWSNSETIEHEVIDGFHRHRVGKECDEIQSRIHGYLPIVAVAPDRENKNDRIASTIRHNRARGKHKVDAMSDIVVELKNRNWSNSRICKELGMDEDEVLRLCQITGLQDLFKDEEFSMSWDVTEVNFEAWEDLTDEVTEMEMERLQLRSTVNASYDRIFHTYDKWECYAAGFFNTSVIGMTKDEAELKFANFLRDINKFEEALNYIVHNWKYSCEQNLTNIALNRIAWLGQAAVCYATGIPSVYRAGWFLLNEYEQLRADNMALKYLNIWLLNNGRDEVSMEEAKPFRQSELY